MSFYYLTGLPPSDVSAAEELQHVADRMSKQFNMPRLRPKDWDELLWHPADQLSAGNAILALDEINWLGRSDPMFSTRLWALWEETLSHLDNFVLILGGSLAGWIDDRFSSNIGYLGRISRNMTLDELPVRDALRFFGTRSSRISLHEQLQLLLVTGGIPRYLEEIDPRMTAEENIQERCFTSGGPLFLEYDQLMNDLFQKSKRVSRAIIEALAEAPLTLEDLGKKLGRRGALGETVRARRKS